MFAGSIMKLLNDAAQEITILKNQIRKRVITAAVYSIPLLTPCEPNDRTKNPKKKPCPAVSFCGDLPALGRTILEGRSRREFEASDRSRGGRGRLPLSIASPRQSRSRPPRRAAAAWVSQAALVGVATSTGTYPPRAPPYSISAAAAVGFSSIFSTGEKKINNGGHSVRRK